MSPPAASPFEEMWKALHEMANALIAANTGLKRVADAALGIHGAYQHVKESLERLEANVEQQTADLARQSAEIRSLRDRLNGGHP